VFKSSDRSSYLNIWGNNNLTYALFQFGYDNNADIEIYGPQVGGTVNLFPLQSRLLPGCSAWVWVGLAGIRSRMQHAWRSWGWKGNAHLNKRIEGSPTITRGYPDSGFIHVRGLFFPLCSRRAVQMVKTKEEAICGDDNIRTYPSVVRLPGRCLTLLSCK